MYYLSGGEEGECVRGIVGDPAPRDDEDALVRGVVHDPAHHIILQVRLESSSPARRR